MSLFLYNNEDDGGVTKDVRHAAAFINNYTATLGLKDLNLDLDKLNAILMSVRMDFPHVDGLNGASPFKKAAYFLCWFIAESPVHSSFENCHLGPMFDNMEGRTNVIIAFELVRAALFEATLICNGKKIVLEREITLSSHSYVDIIEALSGITPQYHFKMVSVLLEQMVYKVNPGCQYKE